MLVAGLPGTVGRGGVEGDLDLGETGESLIAWSSDLSVGGGETLGLPSTTVMELVDLDWRRTRVGRTGAGAVASGGKEGDLKRVASGPSVLELESFDLSKAIGKREWMQRSGMSVLEQLQRVEAPRLLHFAERMAVVLQIVYVLQVSCRVRSESCNGRLG